MGMPASVFPRVDDNSKSLYSVLLSEEKHIINGASQQTEKQRNLIQVFSAALSCLHIPGKTQVFPPEVYSPSSHYKQVPTTALQFGSH